MRRLIKGFAILAVVFCGYWYGASVLIRRGAEAVQAGLTDQGVTARLAETSTTGFPLRFVTRLFGVEVTDSVSGYGWQGETLELEVPSYLPTRLSLRLPPEQMIRTPAGVLTLMSSSLTLDASVGLSPDAPLTQAHASGSQMHVTGPLGEIGRLEDLTLTLGVTETPLDYSVMAEALGLALPSLPPAAERVTVEGIVTLTKPLDRFAGDSSPPALSALQLKEARLKWGGGEVTLRGKIVVAADGLPDGTLDLTATGWEAMIETAVAGGLVKPEVAPTWISMGTMLAEGKPQIALPLVFADGQMRLGPFPLGPAPRLR